MKFSALGWGNGFKLSLRYRPRAGKDTTRVCSNDKNYGRTWSRAEDITEEDKSYYRQWVDSGLTQGGGSTGRERTWSSGRRFPERSSSRVVTDDNEVAVRRCVDSLVVSVTRMSRADSCDSWSQKKSAGAGAAVAEAAADAQVRAIPPHPRPAG
jgi:hypothetical protein